MTRISDRRDARDAAKAQGDEAYLAELQRQAQEGGPLRRAIGQARLNRYEADAAGDVVSSGIMERAMNMPTYEARDAQSASLGGAGQISQIDPNQATSQLRSYMSALGIRSPEEQAGAKRDAVMGALNKESYMGALRDAQQLAQQGQSTGARSQALSVLRGSELAGKKAQAEASIQGQMDAIRQALLGQSIGLGRDMQDVQEFNVQQARADKQADVAADAVSDQRRLQELQSLLMKQEAQTQAEMFDFGRKEGDVFRFKDMLPSLIQTGMQTGMRAATMGAG